MVGSHVNIFVKYILIEWTLILGKYKDSILSNWCQFFRVTTISAAQKKLHFRGLEVGFRPCKL